METCLMRRSLIIFVILMSTSLSFSETVELTGVGHIHGIIYQRSNGMPLADMNVHLVGSEQHFVTNVDGVFQFNNLVNGGYRIRVFASGFLSPEDTVVIVRSGNVTNLQIAAERAHVLFDEVVVTTRSRSTTVSRQSMPAKEIKRIPGTAGDAIRALQALPGIGSAADFDGSLYIRGGSPEDNVFYFDRTRIGYPYHFGGLVSTLSSEVIERIDVYAGGFGAEFGSDAQAVIDIYSRPGNPKHMSGKLNMNLLYSEGLLEGPIGKSGSWYLSGRRSYVDLLPITVDSITTFPRFWDYQFRTTYDLTPKHKISLSAFAADDFMEFKLGVDRKEFAGDLLFENGFDGQGIHLESLLTDRFTSYLSLSRSFNHFNLSFGEGFFLKIAAPDYEFRQDAVFRLNSAHRFESGLLLGTSATSGSAFFPRRPDEGDPDFDFAFEEKIRDTFRIRYNRAEAYLQNRYSPFAFLSIAAGFRIDYLNVTNQISLGPRASLKFRIPSGSQLRFAYGRYEQSPQPPLNFPNFGNPDVKSSRAHHYTMEVERQISSKTGFRIAGYYKDLANLITSDSDAIYLNQGYGFARGLELFLRHDTGARFFGWVSYAYARSERRDRPTDLWRLYSFDQTHVATLTGSYNLSPTMEIGVKWQYSSGNPYTPVVGSTLERHPTTGGLIYRPIFADTNSGRLTPFHRLDVRINKAFSFNRWKMAVYFELLNVYNRKNLFRLSFDEDEGTYEKIFQLPIIPYLGVKAEF